MTQKECDRARGAHHLEITSGDISGHRKKKTEQRRGTHILKMASRGKVRTRKEMDRARGTYVLETPTEG